MIIDITEKMELEKLSVDELNELKNSIISMLQNRNEEVREQAHKTTQERETERIFENVKKNAVALGRMMKGTIFGEEIQTLLDNKQYTAVIEQVAILDFSNRERPHLDESRYSKDNQINVRALLIFESMQDSWMFCCDDLGGELVDVSDAFYHYDVKHVDLIPILMEKECGITEETVQKYLQDISSDQSLNIDVFFKVIMMAEDEGRVHPKDYTFIHAISEQSLAPLPFQLERVIAAREEKGPIRKLKRARRGTAQKILAKRERLMAEKDQAIKDADYEKAASLRQQICKLS